MIRLSRIISIVFSLGLFACHSNVKELDKVSEETLKLERQNAPENPKENTKVKDLRNECVRGQAEPVIIKTVFPNTKFILQSDSLTAIETVEFENGDKLIIRNWGCEYYVLTFRFETSRYIADTTAMKYWYVAACKIMKDIKHGIDAPIDIENGLLALNKHISGNVFDLKLQTEIDFGGSEIREFVSLDRIEKLENNRFALTITFATGPL